MTVKLLRTTKQVIVTNATSGGRGYHELDIKTVRSKLHKFFKSNRVYVELWITESNRPRKEWGEDGFGEFSFDVLDPYLTFRANKSVKGTYEL